jgi:glycosyltransferase involved in cell wall biosynthesis
VIVDSGSTDDTLAIVASYPNTEVHQRQFDHFADQCNFGLEKIKTDWVLSIDADYLCDSKLAEEITGLNEGIHSGYESEFVYCVFGRPLRASLYPPRIVLYRRDAAAYHRDGHAHRVMVDGAIGRLSTSIRHDDRKPLSMWLEAQGRYARDEARKLTCGQQLGWKDWLRLWYWPAPMLTFLYCLFVKMLILDGRAGLYYVLQRVYAETLLSIQLLDLRLRNRGSDEPEPTDRHAESLSSSP